MPLTVSEMKTNALVKIENNKRPSLVTSLQFAIFPLRQIKEIVISDFSGLKLTITSTGFFYQAPNNNTSRALLELIDRGTVINAFVIGVRAQYGIGCDEEEKSTALKTTQQRVASFQKFVEMNEKYCQAIIVRLYNPHVTKQQFESFVTQFKRVRGEDQNLGYGYFFTNCAGTVRSTLHHFFGSSNDFRLFKYAPYILLYLLLAYNFGIAGSLDIIAKLLKKLLINPTVAFITNPSADLLMNSIGKFISLITPIALFPAIGQFAVGYFPGMSLFETPNDLAWEARWYAMLGYNKPITSHVILPKPMGMVDFALDKVDSGVEKMTSSLLQPVTTLAATAAGTVVGGLLNISSKIINPCCSHRVKNVVGNMANTMSNTTLGMMGSLSFCIPARLKATKTYNAASKLASIGNHMFWQSYNSKAPQQMPTTVQNARRLAR